jgi:hypothetical protein
MVLLLCGAQNAWINYNVAVERKFMARRSGILEA